jgi:hypothetical protein
MSRYLSAHENLVTDCRVERMKDINLWQHKKKMVVSVYPGQYYGILLLSITLGYASFSVIQASSTTETTKAKNLHQKDSYGNCHYHNVEAYQLKT